MSDWNLIKIKKREPIYPIKSKPIILYNYYENKLYFTKYKKHNYIRKYYEPKQYLPYKHIIVIPPPKPIKPVKPLNRLPRRKTKKIINASYYDESFNDSQFYYEYILEKPKAHYVRRGSEI
jgi:hypothetical protein